MEILILIGGLISVPIIQYCTRPVPAAKPVETEEKPKEPKQTTEITPEQREANRKKAELRQERILKNLTPYEQELFKEYIEGLKNPKPENTVTKFLTFCGFVALISLLLLAAYIIVTAGNSVYKQDL